MKTYPSAKALFDDPDVDLVIIATPHNTHAELAVKALRSGKHVVVDKVMCMNVNEADEMIAARDQTGLCLSVFHNRRWDGDFLTVKKLIDSGLLGRVYYTEISHLRGSPSSGWRAQKAMSGGILYDWGAHFVDQALILAQSPPVSVHCIVQSVKWGLDIGDNGMMTIAFEDNSCTRIWVGHAAQISRPHWWILGTQGAFSKDGTDPQEKAMCERDIFSAAENPENYGELVTHIAGLEHRGRIATLDGDWTAFYRNVADHLLECKDLAIKPDEVRRAIRVFDAATESARTGQTVRL